VIKTGEKFRTGGYTFCTLHHTLLLGTSKKDDEIGDGVARTGGMRNGYNIIGKREGKRQLGRRLRKREDNIKIDF
jgi:hypothetical protein